MKSIKTAQRSFQSSQSKVVLKISQGKTRKKKMVHNKDVPSRTICFKKKRCLCCSTKMHRISATDKYHTDIEGRQRLFVEIYACPNKKCALFGKRIKPVEFIHMIVPRFSYGIDIFAKIGFLRFRENKSIPEIHEKLLLDIPHIEISQRHTENLVKVFMVFMETAKKNPAFLKQRLSEKVPNLKGLVISIDGIEPEKGNEILYIIREVQSGEIMLAIFLEFSDQKTIEKEIIKPLKEIIKSLDLPVLGFVADKQLSITKAIESVFPNVPIQHCQSHFLKEMRKPICKKDSEMARGIKKNCVSGKSKGKLQKKRKKRGKRGKKGK